MRSRRKVLAVTFVLDALLDEGVQDRSAVVKVLVQKENKVFRQR